MIGIIARQEFKNNLAWLRSGWVKWLVRFGARETGRWCKESCDMGLHPRWDEDQKGAECGSQGLAEDAARASERQMGKKRQNPTCEMLLGLELPLGT